MTERSAQMPHGFAGGGTSLDESKASGTMAAADSPRTLAEARRTFLRHASPRSLIALLCVCLGLRVALAGWSVWDAVVVAAVIAYWPIQEWLIHVLILHYKPITVFGKTIDFAVPKSHRTHHRDPWNLEILFIPVQGFMISLPILVAFWFGLMPSYQLALTGVSIYIALSLNYEWIHFLVHTRYPPRSHFYRRLWRNHRLHHCKNERYWFGVSMLGGDLLLRTAPAVDEVDTSPTCRELEAAAR